MDPEGKPEGETASFTVKSLSVEARKLAGACAIKQGQTMGEWLARAIRNQANLEAGERVLPPGRAKPEPGLPSVQPIQPGQTASLAELAEAVQALAVLAQATGEPLPSSLGKEAYAAIRQRLREARGLPGRRSPPKRPPGPMIEG